MNRSIILQGAVVTALALASGTAFAAPGDKVLPSSVLPENVLYISGATATDNVLRNFAAVSPVANALCDSSQNDITVITSTTGTARGFIISCTSNAAATGGTSVNIAIVKETLSGSAAGIRPVADQTNIAFMDPATTTCTTFTASNVAGLQTIYNGSGCTVGTVTRPPHMGASDVEAALFGQSESGLTNNRGVQILEAPVVNVGLYHALQEATGLSVNDESYANMPTLTASTLGAIYSGRITNWSNIKQSDGTTNLGASPSYTWGDGVAAAQSTNTVFLCRRGNTSGTQKTFEQYFLRQGCAAGVATFRGATGTGAVNQCTTAGCAWSDATYGTATNTVFAGDGTGDVLSCLHYHDSQRRFAIGIASVESTWGTSQSNTARRNWRYIGINGVRPDLANLQSGLYDFFAQSVIYTQSNGAPSGTPGQVKSFITSNLDVSSTIALVNKGTQYNTAGLVYDGGLLAIPTATAAATFPINRTNVRANPVGTVLKSTTAGATLNCNPARGRDNGVVYTTNTPPIVN